MGETTMTDGARQRSSTAGSSKDAADGKQSGSNVALKKEIGLVSACGIIVGKCAKSQINLSHEVRRDGGGGPPAGGSMRWRRCVRGTRVRVSDRALSHVRPEVRRGSDSTDLRVTLLVDVLRLDSVDRRVAKHPRAALM